MKLNVLGTPLAAFVKNIKLALQILPKPHHRANYVKHCACLEQKEDVQYLVQNVYISLCSQFYEGLCDGLSQD